MNITEFNKLHDKLTTQAKNIIHLKNKDYGADEDVLSNFKRISQRFGDTVAMGLLYRIEDKIGRLHAFSKTSKYVVKDEKVEDTVIDLINYAVFLAASLIGEEMPDQEIKNIANAMCFPSPIFNQSVANIPSDIGYTMKEFKDVTKY